MSYINYVLANATVNTKRVETGILSSPDLKFRYLLPHPLMKHMNTLVYVYSFPEIKHILYSMEIELLQK